MGRAGLASQARRARPVQALAPILGRCAGGEGPTWHAMLAYAPCSRSSDSVFLARNAGQLDRRPAETSALLRDLSRVLPGTSARPPQDSSAAWASERDRIGPEVIGGVVLLWSSLGFLSRAGIRAERPLRARRTAASALKPVVLGLLAIALIGLLAGLTIMVGSRTALSQVAPGLLAHSRPGASVAGSARSAPTTLSSLPIVHHHYAAEHRAHGRQVLPRAVIATVLLQNTFGRCRLCVRSRSRPSGPEGIQGRGHPARVRST